MRGHLAIAVVVSTVALVVASQARAQLYYRHGADIVEEIRSGLSRELPDPDSARIVITRGVRVGTFDPGGDLQQSGRIVCATLNAKNLYGAYTGIRDFAFVLGDQGRMAQLGDKPVYLGDRSAEAMKAECNKPADPVR